MVPTKPIKVDGLAEKCCSARGSVLKRFGRPKYSDSTQNIKCILLVEVGKPATPLKVVFIWLKLVIGFVAL